MYFNYSNREIFYSKYGIQSNPFQELSIVINF